MPGTQKRLRENIILIHYENSKQPSNPPHPNTDGAPGWLTQHALLCIFSSSFSFYAPLPLMHSEKYLCNNAFREHDSQSQKVNQYINQVCSFTFEATNGLNILWPYVKLKHFRLFQPILTPNFCVYSVTESDYPVAYIGQCKYRLIRETEKKFEASCCYIMKF